MVMYQATRFANELGKKVNEDVTDVLTGHDPSIVYVRDKHKVVVGAFNYGLRDDEYSNLSQICFSSPRMIVPYGKSVAPFAKDAEGSLVGLDIGRKLSELEKSPDTAVYFSDESLDRIAHKFEEKDYKRYF
ncbi:MAG: hypothetical protein ACQESF_06575 [Nanobdellota archaeon]